MSATPTHGMLALYLEDRRVSSVAIQHRRVTSIAIHRRVTSVAKQTPCVGFALQSYYFLLDCAKEICIFRLNSCDSR